MLNYVTLQGKKYYEKREAFYWIIQKLALNTLKKTASVVFGRSGPGKLRNLIKSALVSFFNLRADGIFVWGTKLIDFFPTAPQGIKEVYIGRFVQSSLLLITKHTSKTRPYQLLGWSSQQWWLFLHSVFWWCPIALLLSGSVHSTTVVEKGRFVQGNFLLQALLKKKKI